MKLGEVKHFSNLSLKTNREFVSSGERIQIQIRVFSICFNPKMVSDQ
jgi:hypothetical protein